MRICFVYLCQERFNPRAREGRDGAIRSNTSPTIRFQSTRPRGARLLEVIGHTIDFAVSIHAPARGATLGWEWRSFPPQEKNIRTDPRLIKVIEQLGTEAASGDHARLRIEEVNPDFAWEIRDHDGQEKIIITA